MIITFWEKKKSIPIKGTFAKILVTIILLIISVFLLYCAINPPAYFPFLKDNINRILYGVVGLVFAFKALKMLFTKERK
ncbi:MAG: hypothetical protein UEP78_08590 [Negativibacillus sp.]|nr:hypothetical protein [Negativibacillus sp.]